MEKAELAALEQYYRSIFGDIRRDIARLVEIESVLGEMNRVFEDDNDDKDEQETPVEEVPASVETTAQITYTNGREEPDEDENSVGMTE